MDQNVYWGPGMTLPTASHSRVHHQHDPADDPSVVTTLQFFQDSMEKQFTSIIDKLDSMGGRMAALETRQKVLEEEVRSSTSSSASISPSVSSSAKKRRRVTPAVLQVRLHILCKLSASKSECILFLLQSKIRAVHNSFDEHKCFKENEA